MAGPHSPNVKRELARRRPEGRGGAPCPPIPPARPPSTCSPPPSPARPGWRRRWRAGRFAGLEPQDRGFARALVMATLRHLGPIDRALDRVPGARAARAGADDPAARRRAAVLPRHPGLCRGRLHAWRLAERSPATRGFKALVNAVLRRPRPRAARRADDPADARPAVALRPLAGRLRRGRRARHRRRDRRGAGDRPDAARSGRRRRARRGAGGRAAAGRLAAPRRPRPTSRNGRASTRAAGGCRTPPPPSRRACWRAQPGETRRSTSAPRPAARRCSSAPPARASPPSTAPARGCGGSPRASPAPASTAEIVTADAETWDDPRQLRRRAARRALHRRPAPSAATPTCSGRSRPRDIAKLAEVQSRLLDAAARRVKPGGRLVYCVCSLEPEEGEAQVARLPEAPRRTSRPRRPTPARAARRPPA